LKEIKYIEILKFTIQVTANDLEDQMRTLKMCELVRDPQCSTLKCLAVNIGFFYRKERKVKTFRSFFALTHSVLRLFYW